MRTLTKFWRPWAAIPMANLTGNPNTIADPTWIPFGPAPLPGHPDYTSQLIADTGWVDNKPAPSEHVLGVVGVAAPGLIAGKPFPKP